MPEPANKATVYRTFINGRNLALEEILQKYLSRIDQIMRGLQLSAEEIALGLLGYQSRYGKDETMERLEIRLRGLFNYAATKIVEEHERLRRSTYTLAYTGEIEALSRALNEPQKAALTRDKVNAEVIVDMPGGGDVDSRIRYFLQKLRRKVIDAINLGLLKDEKPPEMADRIRSAFPRQKKVKRPKKQLKGPKLKEAKEKPKKKMPDFDSVFEFAKTLLPPTRKDPKVAMTTGFIDDSAWQDLVNDYLAKEISPLRGPDDILSLQIKSPTTGKLEQVDRYVWELEKEITQDFVDRVRKGQVDAANDNGIKDFVWIAILDSDTDECCRWRDGKTTSEIKKLLRGSKSGDPCKATVPPAHFFCRCDIAPITGDLPDKTEQLGDFETWLRDG